jgi:hypothetical protein
MASRRRSTRWAPALWERVYKDVTIWVEEMYSRSPRWEWSSADFSGGRAKTKAAAMRAAERAIDEALRRLSNDSRRK